VIALYHRRSFIYRGFYRYCLFFIRTFITNLAKFGIIVYRLNSLREIVREVYHGRMMLTSSIKGLSGEVEAVDIVYSRKGESGLVFVSHTFSKTAFLGDIEVLEFTYDHERLEEASCIRLVISRAPRGGETRTLGTFYRIFDIG